MMSIRRSCCSCFASAAEENRFRSLCTSSGASASATASTDDDDKDDDGNRRRIRERKREEEEEGSIEENPNENAWRRMVREADEFVLPPALRLKTLASSRVEDDGNKTKNIESSLSSLISNVPAKAIVIETNRLTNRKGFYNDIKSDYIIDNNNNENNGKNSMELPKHFEKAVKKAIQSEGSSNKQLARKGKSLLEVLRTASRGFPDDQVDDFNDSSEDFRVRSWVKEGLDVKGSKNSSHRSRMNDSATKMYEDDGEDEDDVEIMKRDWDADIEWGARLSVRKMRRMQMEEAVFVGKAKTRTGAKKKLGDFAASSDDPRQQIQSRRNAPKYDQTEAAAYAITRAPMTLGAITNVLNEIHLRLNGGSLDEKVASFSPETLLDFGSGSVFVGAMAARNVFGDHVGMSKTGRKSIGDDRDESTRSNNRVAFAAVDKSSHGMVFAKRVEEYMRDEAEKEGEEDTKLGTKEDENGKAKDYDDNYDDNDDDALPIQWSEDTFVPESVRNNRRFPTPEAWSEGSKQRSVASLAALQDRSASSFDLVLACYSLGEVMVEAENEERRIKSGMTSSKHLSGANKTFGMRKVDLLARQLWDKTADGGVLVIVEPGTPRGSKLVRRVRQLVLDYEERNARNAEKKTNAAPNSVKSNAHVVAPCQHDKKCPMSVANEKKSTSQMWCHFSQRVERTATHRLMLARGKGRTYQDERFSYVAIQKLPRDQAEELAESKALRILEEENNADGDAFFASESLTSSDDDYNDEEEEEEEEEEDESEEDEDEDTFIFDESTKSKARAVAMASQPLWSRVVRPPIKRRGHVVIETCEPNGKLEKRTVAKSHGTVFGIGRDGYRRARKTKLGDLFSFEDVKKRTTIDTDDDFDIDGTKNTIINNRAGVVFDEEKFIMDWLEQKKKVVE